jgi:hypothetical protein
VKVEDGDARADSVAARQPPAGEVDDAGAEESPC